MRQQQQWNHPAYAMAPQMVGGADAADYAAPRDAGARKGHHLPPALKQRNKIVWALYRRIKKRNPALTPKHFLITIRGKSVPQLAAQLALARV